MDSVQIVYDKVYGDSKGFGFIYFRRIRDATEVWKLKKFSNKIFKAREHLSDVKIHGVRVRVDYSVTNYALRPK